MTEPLAERNIVQQVVDALSETYNAEGVVVWLQAGQQWDHASRVFHGATALEMIRWGGGDAVLDRAKSLTGMVAT